MTSSRHKFQVNLGGLIELLSNHLYGTPEVFVRELLQNSVDAIVAARRTDGRIRIVVDEPSRLTVEDNGIGLSEEEVHRFLATIGESSKRDPETAHDFIGRFGIGLLSCFVVADEIVVVTHKADHPAIEWRGKVDGTYDVRPAAGDPPVGTRVELVAKPATPFVARELVEHAQRYGGLLPVPIEVVHGAGRTAINDRPPVFRRTFRDEASRTAAALEYGKEVFGEQFLDAIWLHSDAGAIDGVAFVARTEVRAGARRADRVYLKGMLLTETAEDLLPPWAGFLRCVIDARDLRPTASREALYHDATLGDAREALAATVCNHLARLAATEEDRLARIVAAHGIWLKAMCLDDDDLLRALFTSLRFETTLGQLPLGELRAKANTIRYAPSVDLYRQLAPVAAAEGIAIVNAGYAYDAELLERAAVVIPELVVEAVTAEDVTSAFEDLSPYDHDRAAPFLRAADTALRSLRCTVDLKQFSPASLPVLYTASRELQLRRTARQVSEKVGGLWGSVLDRVTSDDRGGEAQLVFNHRNPLVQRLVEQGGNQGLLHHAVRALYVQALMLGHHTLEQRELAAMNDSLIGLVDLAALSNLGRARGDA